MTEINVPAGLPMLRRGIGRTPVEGGCLIQVSSYLHDGRSWTDDTPCVHPVLRQLAIHVNDAVSDAMRPLLAPLAADLVGTGPGLQGIDGVVASVRLAVWAVRRVAHLVRDKHWLACDAAVDAAEARSDCPSKSHPEAAAATYATTYTSPDAVHAAAAVAGACATAAYATAAYATCAARDQALIGLLRDAIAEHRRLTGDIARRADASRWRGVCELVGVTS